MFHKKHPPAGSRPGTLMISDDAVPPRITAIRYTADDVHVQDVDRVAELKHLREQPGILWIDVQGLGDADLLRELAAMFDIHALALEDVINAPQRPKTETYDDHQLYISRMVKVDAGGAVEIEQVSIFFGSTYVLTFQEHYGDVLDPVRLRIHQGAGPMRRSGSDYLAYAIIDTIIDHYYPVVEMISDALERAETRVLQHADRHILATINRMKRTLVDLRRGIWPQRDAVNALVRGDSRFVSKDVRVYFRDCYDHAVQIVDVIDASRDIASSLFNTYLSVVSNRMNEVMKVLTIMASIFIPLTFMAGIYGMNFSEMPELHVKWAYPGLLTAMVIVAGGMLLYFRRKGWLGSPKASDDDEPMA